MTASAPRTPCGVLINHRHGADGGGDHAVRSASSASTSLAVELGLLGWGVAQLLAMPWVCSDTVFLYSIRPCHATRCPCPRTFPRSACWIRSAVTSGIFATAYGRRRPAFIGCAPSCISVGCGTLPRWAVPMHSGSARRRRSPASPAGPAFPARLQESAAGSQHPPAGLAAHLAPLLCHPFAAGRL